MKITRHHLKQSRDVPKHQNIPEDLMELYKQRKMTSKELAEATGYHPVYIRRSIERYPKAPKDDTEAVTRKRLKEARDKFRSTLAHLPIEEIAKLAHVSRSTAGRIKRKYQK